MIEVKNWHRRGWRHGKINLKTGEFLVRNKGKRWYPGAEMRTVDENDIILVGAEQ